MEKTSIAIYAGTFDPVTNGHLDVIKRGLNIFKEIIIAVSADAKDTLFSTEERVEMLKAATDNQKVTIEPFKGLLVEFAQKKECNVLLRGLRVISDFDYEFQMDLMNRKLNAGIETVFIMTSQEYSFLSSSAVKDAAKLKGKISCLVPEIVEKKLKEKFHL